MASAKLAKRTVNQSQTATSQAKTVPGRRFDRDDGDEHAPDLDDEHDRVAHHAAGVELEDALARGPQEDRAVEQ